MDGDGKTYDNWMIIRGSHRKPPRDLQLPACHTWRLKAIILTRILRTVVRSNGGTPLAKIKVGKIPKIMIIKVYDFPICLGGKNVSTCFISEPRLFDARDKGILEGFMESKKGLGMY